MVSNFQNYFHFKTFEIKIKNIEKHEIGKNSFKRRTFERSKISRGPKAELVIKNGAGRKQKLLSFWLRMSWVGKRNRTSFRAVYTNFQD